MMKMIFRPEKVIIKSIFQENMKKKSFKISLEKPFSKKENLKFFYSSLFPSMISFQSMLVASIEDAPRKYLFQLINREQHFVTALQYGMQRFANPLQERRDLISPTDHRTLFQNIEEILRLSEDILEQLIPDEYEPQLMFASRVYLSKSTAFCAAYKKYCNGLKRADCVLVSGVFSVLAFLLIV